MLLVRKLIQKDRLSSVSSLKLTAGSGWQLQQFDLLEKGDLTCRWGVHFVCR